MSSIGILGAGTWGIALARMLCVSGHKVTVWSPLADELYALRETRRQNNLPNVEIPVEIDFIDSIEDICKDKDILLFAVPSIFVRTTAKLASPYVVGDQIIVDAAKGIETKTLLTMSEVIKSEIPQAKVVALSGPTHAEEVARDLPTTIVVAYDDLSVAENDSTVELELLFVDDLIEEMYNALESRPHHAEYPKEGEIYDGKIYDGVTPRPTENGRYCYVPNTHKATLGEIVDWLYVFHEQPRTLIMPRIPGGSFEKKLYSMYLSYIPKEKMVIDMAMNCDNRGSFTELLKTTDHGQISVNISKPGITKGQHWHNSKWELFIVVSGHGLIQERKIGTDEIIEFEVSGSKIQAVQMLPGYTHNIINLSETEDLVTLMWANEIFDSKHPDTFFQEV